MFFDGEKVGLPSTVGRFSWRPLGLRDELK
jgi:hypothetical protein